ncbi:MAG: hypothetical protein ABJD07_11970 [Gemmatimonadaceae bacterium]
MTPAATLRQRLSIPLVLALAIAFHTDWHIARSSEHHRMSFSWGQHWLLAIPIFAAAALYLAGRRHGDPGRDGALNIGLAIVLAQLAEPFAEVAYYHHAMGLWIEPARWTAFAIYACVGLSSYAAAAWLLARRPPVSIRTGGSHVG